MSGVSCLTALQVTLVTWTRPQTVVIRIRDTGGCCYVFNLINIIRNTFKLFIILNNCVLYQHDICTIYSVVWEEDIGKSLSPSPNILSIGWGRNFQT